MKTVLLRFLFCGALALTSTYPSLVHAQTQKEMNEEAGEDFEAADALLNKVYKQLLAKLDKEAQEHLKVAEKAWLVFRDAEALFAADMARGGSMAALVHEERRMELTKARTKELKEALANRDR